MQPILETLSDFKNAVAANRSVVCDAAGNWYIDGVGMRFVRWLLKWETSRKESVVEVFCRCMDEREEAGESCFQNHLYNAAVVVLKRYGNAANSWMLAYRICALEYRLEIWRREHCVPALYESVCKIAEVWKREQSHFRSFDLTDSDYAHLDSIKNYPGFAQLLRDSISLQHVFFTWTLTDKNDSAPFIELPGVAGSFLSSQLSARVGKYDLLKFDRTNHVLKVLTDHGVYCELGLSQKQLVFSRSYTLSFQDFIWNFFDKERGGKTLEATPCGIANWNSRTYSSLNAKTGSLESVDFTKRDWWTQLTAVARVSAQELQQQMPYDWRQEPLQLESDHWVFSIAVMTENNKKLLMSDTHGFLMVAIPDGREHYQMYPFGKYLKENYPHSKIEKLQVVFSYLQAAIVFPDDTIFRSNRDVEYIPVVLPERDAYNVMDRVCLDIQKGLAGKLPFQLLYANCLDWVFDVLSDHIPKERMIDLSSFNPFQTHMDGGVGTFSQVYRKTPKCLINPALTALAYCFGASKEMEMDGKRVSFLNDLPWYSQNFKIPNPSLMFLNRRASCKTF